MLMSMKEVVAWTGTGPFEISFHAMSWLWFTVLLLLKVEDVWDISYYHVFIPLFAAVGIHIFFLAILVTKFVLLRHNRTHAVTYITLLLLILPLLSMLLLAEIQISHYLEKDDDDSLEGFTIAASIFISLLFLSMFVMFRTTQSDDD